MKNKASISLYGKVHIPSSKISAHFEYRLKKCFSGSELVFEQKVLEYYLSLRLKVLKHGNEEIEN